MEVGEERGREKIERERRENDRRRRKGEICHVWQYFRLRGKREEKGEGGGIMPEDYSFLYIAPQLQVT